MALKLIGATLLSAVAFVLWAITSPTTSIEPLSSQDERAVVTRVLDGDTIVVTGGKKVRYIGIDTPELYGSTQDSECFAREAKSRNEQLILGKPVRLEKDVSEADKYNRLLRYVYIDDPLSSIHEDTSINEILVSEGYAFARTYQPDIALQKHLTTLEKEAREKGFGLWGGCK